MSLAACSTSSCGVAHVKYLRVDAVSGALAAQDAVEVARHHRGLAGLGVVGGATDVRGEHDVRHRAQRMVSGQVLAPEVVEAGRRDLAGLQRGHERVAIVQVLAGAC